MPTNKVAINLHKQKSTVTEKPNIVGQGDATCIFATEEGSVDIILHVSVVVITICVTLPNIQLLTDHEQPVNVMQETNRHTKRRTHHIGHELIASHVNKSTAETEVWQQQEDLTQDVVDTIKSLSTHTTQH